MKKEEIKKVVEEFNNGKGAWLDVFKDGKECGCLFQASMSEEFKIEIRDINNDTDDRVSIIVKVKLQGTDEYITSVLFQSIDSVKIMR